MAFNFGVENVSYKMVDGYPKYTDEILKNIIAERVLGLPADVRVDKDVAFSDLPAGKRA